MPDSENMVLLPVTTSATGQTKSATEQTKFVKPRVNLHLVPTWSVSNQKTTLGTSCGCPHYSYVLAITAPEVREDEYQTALKIIERKTRIVVDALMHHTLEERLDASHGHEKKGSIDSRTDYEQYKALLTDAAKEAQRFTESTGPLEVTVSIEVHDGYVATARSCNRYRLKTLWKPFSITDSIRADDPSAFRPTNHAAADMTTKSWRMARMDASGKVKVPKGQGDVDDNMLQDYALTAIMSEEDKRPRRKRSFFH